MIFGEGGGLSKIGKTAKKVSEFGMNSCNLIVVRVKLRAEVKLLIKERKI